MSTNVEGRARRRVPHHAKLYYKVVAARDDGSFRSIYDGTTNYAVGEVTTGSPLYACHSIGAVVVHGRHRLSDECAMLDAPRAILRCWGWRLDGSLPAPVGTPGKYRLDALLPIAALPWSSTGGHDGIPPYSQLRPPARGVASAVVCGPAALRRGGARWEQRRWGHRLPVKALEKTRIQLHWVVFAAPVAGCARAVLLLHRTRPSSLALTVWRVHGAGGAAASRSSCRRPLSGCTRTCCA